VSERAPIPKPLPQPTAQSRPFWDACASGELRLQRCNACGAWWFPPAERCPECLGTRWTWAKASGRGRVYSFVVYHRAYHPAFASELPYVVALVELEEGPRLISNLIGCAVGCASCEMAVEVVFEQVAEGVNLPKFRPRSTGGSGQG
jgi:uncharacterized OB-fold protein